QVWHIGVIEVINGAAAAFTFPAMQGMLRQLVDHGQIPQAAALNGLTRNVTVIGGSALGGVIVGFAGSGWGLVVDAASFGVAAVLHARIRIGGSTESNRSMLRDLVDGWREFTARRWVWVIVVAFFVINAINSGLMRTLGPVIADDSFGRVGWGTLSAAQGIGFVIGALIMLRWRPRRPMVIAMLAVLLDVPLMVLLGIHPAFLPLLVLFFLAGIGSDLFGIGWETALQQHIPPEKLSRVASYDQLGSIAAIPVGQLLAGPLAAVLGAGPVIAVGGVVVGVTALVTVAEPSVRRLRRTETAPVADPASMASG
ncbi:MAG: MFS transporter, partial [Stackebrandtia sp.]